MAKRKVAVLGATGVVGQQFVSMLQGHPQFEIWALAASSRSAGKRYGECLDCAGEREIPEALKKEEIIRIDGKVLKKLGIEIAFSALPSDIAKEEEPLLAKAGIAVFSNASAYRMQPDVPILIPEVNAEHLALVESQRKLGGGFIVTDSNCTTSGLVIALKPLMKYGLRSAIVSTYQAVSGAGYPGESALDIMGNVIPYIESEEPKVEREARKILGRIRKDKSGVDDAPVEVITTCVRVPVRHGHFETVVAEFGDLPTVPEARKALAQFRGAPAVRGLPTAPEHPIIVRDELDRPQPLYDASAGTPARAAGMAVTVGRIEEKCGRLRLALLVHNTIRGAAGTSILNAELALREKHI